MTQSQSAHVGEHANHQHTEATHESHASHHDWHPDMSRERPEWKTAHARERECHLELSEHGMYTVRKGDTLFDIAIRLLKETNESTNAAAILSKVNDIAHQNIEHCPQLIGNPHLIQPGQVLRILADTVNALNIPRLSAADGLPVPPADQSQINQFAPALAPAQADVSQVPPDENQINQFPPAVGTADVPPPPPPPSSPADLPPQSVQDSAAPVDGSQYAPADAPPEVQTIPTQMLPPAVQGGPSTAPQVGDATTYAAPPPPEAYPATAIPDNSFYGTQDGRSYTDQEALRLASMMVNDPHRAAAELRDQISQLDPQSAGMLITETKNDEIPNGLGDLQIQANLDQYGRDTGFRNVTMATPDGVEQIAELQSQPTSNVGDNPLGFVAGMIVGDLLWQQQRGVDFNDPQYRSWCNREQSRENYWNTNNGEFVQNWKDQNYRNQFQTQNWQQAAFSSNVNNTFITNNRYDTTINNRQVNTTEINNTINNTTKYVDSHVPMSADGHPIHRQVPVVQMPHAIGGNKFPQVRPQDARHVANTSDAQPAVTHSAQAPVRDKEFWKNQAADMTRKQADSANAQTPAQAELRKEMEAEQQQQAADRAKADRERASQKSNPNWMEQQSRRMSEVPGTGANQRTPDQQKADLVREKEADQRREAADRAKAVQERNTQPAVPNWMAAQAQKMKDAQGPAKATPEQHTSDAAQDRAAQQKQDAARETEARTVKAAQEHQKLVDSAREQQKALEDAKEKAAAQPKHAAQQAVVIPQLVGAGAR